jgi:hypothetical protein
MERFSAIVLSQDQDILQVIHRAFEEFGLKANVVRTIGHANELVKGARFDLAVCDYDFPGANQLAYLNPKSEWRGMIFALIRQEQLATVKGQRVHLTLSKPLTQRLFTRSLRAAYTTMAHERRAAFRHPVGVDAAWAELISSGEQRKIQGVRIRNVSRTGMCIECRELLPQRSAVRLAFELPRNGGLITTEGDVVWAKAPGQCGIKFSNMASASQQKLIDWMDANLDAENGEEKSAEQGEQKARV